MNVVCDAEAARVVVRQPIDQAFIPLDVTNTVPMTECFSPSKSPVIPS